MPWWLDTRDKPGLLWALLRHCMGAGRVSLEGNLRPFGILDLPGNTHEETELLRRHTVLPRQDFVILPIVAETLSTLKRKLSSPGIFNDGGALWHVHVEYQGQVVLSAYDNFHRNCVVVNEPIPIELLDELVSSGALRGYQTAPYAL